jgi:hypothetical protein
MKYLKYCLVAGLVIFITSSYTTGTSRLFMGTNTGEHIPDFYFQDARGCKLKLSDLKGKKALVTLWAAYDAKSHMQHVLFSNVLKKGNYPVEMVSISFDQSEPVFENTLSMDGISNNYQFVDTRGSNSDIYRRYRLDKGFKSFLIDENGLILTVNPTLADLNKLCGYE